MASIKRFQIKGLKTFRGRDWDGAQGDIYLNGKKVGWYNDAGNGGMADIDFWQGDRDKKDQAEKCLDEAVKAYYAEHPMKSQFVDLKPDGELFFAELLNLMEDEKQYKKMLKKGFPSVIFYKETENSAYECIVGLSVQADVEQYLRENKIGECRIYRSLADFDIK